LRVIVSRSVLVGTIYGDSMYSAIDPFYMLMLMRILEREYTVDKFFTLTQSKTIFAPRRKPQKAIEVSSCIGSGSCFCCSNGSANPAR
jgi:hypothetical protein